MDNLVVKEYWQLQIYMIPRGDKNEAWVDCPGSIGKSEQDGLALLTKVSRFLHWYGLVRRQVITITDIVVTNPDRRT